MDTRQRVTSFEVHFPYGWWAADPYSPEQSQRNGFGFLSVYVV